MKLWVKLFQGTVRTSMSRTRLSRMFIMATRLVTTKMTHHWKQLASQLRWLAWTIQAKSVLAKHLCCIVTQLMLLANLLSQRRRLIVILGKSWKMALSFWNLVMFNHQYGSWQTHVCWELLWLSSGPFCYSSALWIHTLLPLESFQSNHSLFYSEINLRLVMPASNAPTSVATMLHAALALSTCPS